MSSSGLRVGAGPSATTARSFAAPRCPLQRSAISRISADRDELQGLRLARRAPQRVLGHHGGEVEQRPRRRGDGIPSRHLTSRRSSDRERCTRTPVDAARAAARDDDLDRPLLPRHEAPVRGRGEAAERRAAARRRAPRLGSARAARRRDGRRRRRRDAAGAASRGGPARATASSSSPQARSCRDRHDAVAARRRIARPATSGCVSSICWSLDHAVDRRMTRSSRARA